MIRGFFCKFLVRLIKYSIWVLPELFFGEVNFIITKMQYLPMKFLKSDPVRKSWHHKKFTSPLYNFSLKTADLLSNSTLECN